MAEPNKRQAKMHPKIKREHSKCVTMFGQHSESQHNVKEKHGSLAYCCIPCYKWTTRRMRQMRRLRSHLNNVRHIEASTNRTLTEFRTATAQSLASSSSHLCTPDTNIAPDSASTPPLRYNDYALMPQAHQIQPDASENYANLQDKVVPQPEYNPAPSSSAASRTRVQVAPRRIFRPCKLRRRASRTSSSVLPLTHQSSAMESTLPLYANEQDNSATFPQRISESFDIELVASSLCSFSLNSLFTEPAANQ